MDETTASQYRRAHQTRTSESRKPLQQNPAVRIFEEDDPSHLSPEHEAGAVPVYARLPPALYPHNRHLHTPSPAGSLSNTSLRPNHGDDTSSVNAGLGTTSEGEAMTQGVSSIHLHDRPSSPSSARPAAVSPLRPFPRKRPSNTVLSEGELRRSKIHNRSRSGPEPQHQRGQSSTAHQSRDVHGSRLPTSPTSVPAARASAHIQPNTPDQKTPAFEELDIQSIDPESMEVGRSAKQEKQPVTTPITQEQLVNEVKGIYAGLVMVEKKCVEIDQQQSSSNSKLTGEQYQALIALHRTLLHEHHDFFLASQHPSASTPLKRLATKYAMPARMWRHGIHSFLELLRHRLPDSLEYMLLFVYLAYSMMTLLMESVPSFEETWIECLGDLARYRMAIEDSDVKERETWSEVAKMWYNRAADRNPGVGRIQHHLAVLARPNIVQQLFYYSKALVTVTPFPNAKESIMLLFNQFLEPNETASQRYQPVEAAFVKANGILFTKGDINIFDDLMDVIIAKLNDHIDKPGAKFIEQGPEMAAALCAAVFDFGNDQSYLVQLFDRLESKPPSPQKPQLSELSKSSHLRRKSSSPSNEPSSQRISLLRVDSDAQRAEMRAYWIEHAHRPPSIPDLLPTEVPLGTRFSGTGQAVNRALSLMHIVMETVFSRGPENDHFRRLFGFAHVLLAFLYSLAFVPKALEFVQAYVPWAKVAIFLNGVHRLGGTAVEGPAMAANALARQVPEDFVMRGLLWSQYYYPENYFSDPKPEEERNLRRESHQLYRAGRCLWLGIQLSRLNHWLHYESTTKRFSVTDFGRNVCSAVQDFSDDRSSTEPLERG